MNEPNDIEIDGFGPLSAFDRLIEQAPDGPGTIVTAKPPSRDIWSSTRMPERYLPEWPRPKDPVWWEKFHKLMARMKAGGIVGLIGVFGCGKTQLAAEVMRDMARTDGYYTTVKDLLMRIRGTYNSGASELETDVVSFLTYCPLLVIDELQTRRDTKDEDDMLSYIIDKRYGARKPVILLSNLLEKNFLESIGGASASRINHEGGVMTIESKSFR